MRQLVNKINAFFCLFLAVHLKGLCMTSIPAKCQREKFGVQSSQTFSEIDGTYTTEKNLQNTGLSPPFSSIYEWFLKLQRKSHGLIGRMRTWTWDSWGTQETVHARSAKEICCSVQIIQISTSKKKIMDKWLTSLLWRVKMELKLLESNKASIQQI